MTRRLDYRDGVLKAYPEVYTPAALEALQVLAPLNRDRREFSGVAINLSPLTNTIPSWRHRRCFTSQSVIILTTSARIITGGGSFA